MCYETSDCLHEECTFDVFRLLEKSIHLNAWKLELAKPTLKMKRKIRGLNVIDSIGRICEELHYIFDCW